MTCVNSFVDEITADPAYEIVGFTSGQGAITLYVLKINEAQKMIPETVCDRAVIIEKIRG